MPDRTCHNPDCDTVLVGQRRKWCSEWCRKTTLYGGACSDCGARLDGSNGRGPRAPIRCRDCAHSAARTWSREQIVDRIREWDRRFGRAPAASEWNRSQARKFGYQDVLDLHAQEPGRWPHSSTVADCFGSWNAAFAAAGVQSASCRVGRRRLPISEVSHAA